VTSVRKAFQACAPLLLALVLAGCGDKPAADNTSASSSAETNLEIHAALGVIKEFRADGKTIVIRHEEVTNYMPAMTMPMEVKHTNQLVGLAVGDWIAFNIVVARTDSWIDQVTKTNPPPGEAAATPPPLDNGFIHFLKNADVLNEGDLLPDFHFTNQFGNAVSTAQFHGSALALTFMFTRCPLPNFCPLMSANFGEAQDKLLALTNAPTNWHLLTISFDPQYDSSPILKLYSARYHCDPARWDFVTGMPDDIATICDQLGEIVERDPSGGINHNLRTVVIDATGHIQKIFVGNEWTSDELVAEMVKAAQKR